MRHIGIFEILAILSIFRLCNINPLVPNAANMQRNAKILILILEGIIKKISYECRDYESVDEKNLS